VKLKANTARALADREAEIVSVRNATDGDSAGAAADAAVYEAAIQGLQQDIDQLKSEKSSKAVAAAKRSGQSENAAGQIARLQQRLQQAKQSRPAHDIVVEVEADRDHLIKVVGDLTVKLRISEAKLRELEVQNAENAGLQSKLCTTGRRVAYLEAILAKVQVTPDLAQAAIEDNLRADLNAARQQLQQSKLNAAVSQGERDGIVESLRECVDRLQQRIDALCLRAGSEDAIDRLREEADALSQDNSVLRRDLQELKGSMALKEHQYNVKLLKAEADLAVLKQRAPREVRRPASVGMAFSSAAIGVSSQRDNDDHLLQIESLKRELHLSQGQLRIIEAMHTGGESLERHNSVSPATEHELGRLSSFDLARHVVHLREEEVKLRNLIDDLEHQRAEDLKAYALENARKDGQLDDCRFQIAALRGQAAPLLLQSQDGNDAKSVVQSLQWNLAAAEARCRALQLSNEQAATELDTKQLQLRTALSADAARNAELQSVNERCQRLQQRIDSAAAAGSVDILDHSGLEQRLIEAASLISAQKAAIDQLELQTAETSGLRLKIANFQAGSAHYQSVIASQEASLKAVLQERSADKGDAAVESEVKVTSGAPSNPSLYQVDEIASMMNQLAQARLQHSSIVEENGRMQGTVKALIEQSERLKVRLVTLPGADQAEALRLAEAERDSLDERIMALSIDNAGLAAKEKHVRQRGTELSVIELQLMIATLRVQKLEQALSLSGVVILPDDNTHLQPKHLAFEALLMSIDEQARLRGRLEATEDRLARVQMRSLEVTNAPPSVLGTADPAQCLPAHSPDSDAQLHAITSKLTAINHEYSRLVEAEGARKGELMAAMEQVLRLQRRVRELEDSQDINAQFSNDNLYSLEERISALMIENSALTEKEKFVCHRDAELAELDCRCVLQQIRIRQLEHALAAAGIPVPPPQYPDVSGRGEFAVSLISLEQQGLLQGRLDDARERIARMQRRLDDAGSVQMNRTNAVDVCDVVPPGFQIRINDLDARLQDKTLLLQQSEADNNRLKAENIV
jgi:hypothetical protein